MTRRSPNHLLRQTGSCRLSPKASQTTQIPSIPFCSCTPYHHSAASKPPDTNPQLATNTPSPTPVRSALSRRAATRARIATKKVQQLESEDDIDDDSEYEHEHTHPHPVVQTMDELPSEDDHQVDDEYDQLDDDTPPRSGRSNLPINLQRSERLLNASDAPYLGAPKPLRGRMTLLVIFVPQVHTPTTRSSPTASSVKFCGIDLSRSDARLRHERTYACGKRNVQQSRDKANAKNRATTA